MRAAAVMSVVLASSVYVKKEGPFGLLNGLIKQLCHLVIRVLRDRFFISAMSLLWLEVLKQCIRLVSSMVKSTVTYPFP